MNKRYCEICGKRIEAPINIQHLASETAQITIRYYVTNHTEPICSGHTIRTPVPQVFADAFKDKELQP